MLEGLTDSLVSFASKLLNTFFPADPIQEAVQQAGSGPVAQWLGILNWFFPVGTIVGILSVWLAAVAVYYIYQIVLRWIKVIK